MRKGPSEKISSSSYVLNRAKNLTTVFATTIALGLSGCGGSGGNNSGGVSDISVDSGNTLPQSGLKMKQTKVGDNMEITFETDNPNSKVAYVVNGDISSIGEESARYDGEKITLEIGDAIGYRLMNPDGTMGQAYSYLNYGNLPIADIGNVATNDGSLADRIKQEEANMWKYQADLTVLSEKKQLKQASLDQIRSTIQQIKLDISTNSVRVANISTFLNNVNNLLNSTSSLDDTFDAKLKSIIDAYYVTKTSKSVLKSISKSVSSQTVTSVDLTKLNQRLNIINSDISTLNSDISKLESNIAIAQGNYDRKYAEYMSWKTDADNDKAAYELAKAEYYKYKAIYYDNKNKYTAIEDFIFNMGYDSSLRLDVGSLLRNNSSNLPYVKYQITAAANEMVNVYNNNSYTLDTTSTSKVSTPNQYYAKQNFIGGDYQVFVNFNATGNGKNYKANMKMEYHTFAGEGTKTSKTISVVSDRNVVDLRDLFYASARSAILGYNVDNMVIYKTNMDSSYSKAVDTSFEAVFNQLMYDVDMEMYTTSLSELNAITSQINSSKQSLTTKKSQLETKKTELVSCQNKINEAQNELNSNGTYIASRNNELTVYDNQINTINSEIYAIDSQYSDINARYLASASFIDSNKDTLNQVRQNDAKLSGQATIVNGAYAYVYGSNYGTNEYKANPMTIYVRYGNNYPAKIWAESKTNDQLTVGVEITVNNLDDLKNSKTRLEQMIKRTQDIRKYWGLPENGNVIRNITATDIETYKNLVLSYIECDNRVLVKSVAKEAMKIIGCSSGGTMKIIPGKEGLYQEALRLYYTANFKYILDNDSAFRQKYYETKNNLVNGKISEIEALENRTLSSTEKSKIAEEIAKGMLTGITDGGLDYAMSYKDLADDVYSTIKSLVSIEGQDVRNFFYKSLEAVSDPIATIESVGSRIKEDMNRIKEGIIQIKNKLEYIGPYGISYGSSYAGAFIGGMAVDPIGKFMKSSKVTSIIEKASVRVVNLIKSILETKIIKLGSAYIGKYETILVKISSVFPSDKQERFLERMAKMDEYMTKQYLDNPIKYIDNFEVGGKYPMLLKGSEQGTILSFDKYTYNNGKIYDSNNQIFDPLKTGRTKPYDFVIINGEIKIGSSHSYLANGKNIDFAGEFQIKDGIITNWNNLSGHYKPSSKDANTFINSLKLKFGNNFPIGLDTFTLINK
ncbi:MAG: hypothetical protein PHS92_02020 [Candidatus Gracilibacteria bacterium]|nr:hypothetical protein [Candidatus Gracilibacteria bacterium]